jgi:hypothetical protein
MGLLGRGRDKGEKSNGDSKPDLTGRSHPGVGRGDKGGTISRNGDGDKRGGGHGGRGGGGRGKGDRN